MRIFANKLLALAGLFTLGVMAMAGMPTDAFAAPGDAAILDSGKSVICAVYTFSINIIYIVGALALMFMVVKGFFSKFAWTPILGIAGGMLAIALLDQIIKFVGGPESALGACD